MAAVADTFTQLQLRMQRRRTRKRNPKPRKLPVALEPRAATLAYTRALLEIISEWDDAIEGLLIPRLPFLVAAQEAGMPSARVDAPADNIERVMADLAAEFNARVSDPRLRITTSAVSRQVSEFNRGQFNKVVTAGLGVNPLAVESGLGNQLGAFVSDNVRLIKKIEEQHLADVQNIIFRGARRGATDNAIAAEIRERTGISERNAKRIARDQVQKLNGELEQSRQQEIGVTRYIWKTSLDERVRGSKKGTVFGADSAATQHARLHNTVQRWDKPPVVNEKTGETGHPGEPIECRCRAEPVLDDLIAQAEGRDPVLPADATTT